MLEFFVRDILGENGVIGVIGIMVFLYIFKYSQNLFDLIEKYTYKTKNYILEQFEKLFIKVNPDHVTYVLLSISVGLGTLVFISLSLFGRWYLGLILGFIVAFAGFKIPIPFVNFLVKKRIKQYSLQMVDGLTLLANGLRAGLSLPQSLSMVISEMPNPISEEFNLILQQNRVGVTLEECFENLVKRVPLEDNDMFVSSVNILRETGGNLSETFDTIVSIIRERVRLQQKIDTYTAQGMFQGYMMAMMPFIVGAIFANSNPKSILLLFTTIPGNLALLLVCLLDFGGLFIILKIVDIKV